LLPFFLPPMGPWRQRRRRLVGCLDFYPSATSLKPPFIFGFFYEWWVSGPRCAVPLLTSLRMGFRAARIPAHRVFFCPLPVSALRRLLPLPPVRCLSRCSSKRIRSPPLLQFAGSTTALFFPSAPAPPGTQFLSTALPTCIATRHLYFWRLHSFPFNRIAANVAASRLSPHRQECSRPCPKRSTLPGPRGSQFSYETRTGGKQILVASVPFPPRHDRIPFLYTLLWRFL